jgi:hypothetical protein
MKEHAMKKTAAIAVIITVLAVSTCGKKVQTVSGVYHLSGEEMAGALVNNALVETGDLPKYVDIKTDDAVVLEMILDYNETNDLEKFADNNGKAIKNDVLKRKMLLLVNNLRN